MHFFHSIFLSYYGQWWTHACVIKYTAGIFESLCKIIKQTIHNLVLAMKYLNEKMIGVILLWKFALKHILKEGWYNTQYLQSFHLKHI